MPMSISATRNRDTLPHQLSPLVGRARELADLEAILVEGDDRLITLTGPGGVGKTRLAIALAKRVADRFPDGVFFIPLAHTASADVVLTAIAQAVDLQERIGSPIAELIAAEIGDKRILLVLDNLEQVLDVASDIATILHRCPNLICLVTSQVRLRLSGEREYVGTPRATSTVDASLPVGSEDQPDAVRLFVERAQAADGRFRLTAENLDTVAAICKAVDGLPLAIELAAARIKILSPEDLLRRLGQQLTVLTGGGRDLPVRQQTMRNAIAWSYGLLSADEQWLLRRLSVFSGGFGMESIERIAAPDTDPLDLLGSLVDKSLVYRSPYDRAGLRYGILATIREFGLEELTRSGELTDARLHHAQAMMAQATDFRREWSQRGADRWLPGMEAELANPLLALARWSEPRDLASGLIHSSSLGVLWDVQSIFQEGLDRSEVFLPPLPSLD